MWIAISALADLDRAVRPTYVEVRRTMTVGSDPACDVVLAGDEVAPHHLQLTVRGVELEIAHLAGSIPLVDGVPVQHSMRTKATSVIIVAGALLRFVAREPKGSQPRIDTKDQWFLEQLRVNPVDLETRLVYADWLEQNGDELQAEYVRLALDPNVAPSDALQSAAPLVLSDSWRATVARAPIHLCPGPHCPRRWEALAPTVDPTERRCGECSRHVRFCTDAPSAIAWRRFRQAPPLALCPLLPRQATLEACLRPLDPYPPGIVIGRPVRIGGEAQFPPVADDNRAWQAAAPAGEELPATRRAELAVAWTAIGRGEHASIAAFAQLSLQLLSLAAPPELVAAAHRAAGDEIEHAKLAFGFAARFAGHPVGPGEFAEVHALDRARTLTELAVESFRDGCIHETASAFEAKRASERAGDPAIAAALTRVAADELRHAELGWDIVAWCTGALGPALRAALVVPEPSLAEPADDGPLARHGILNDAAKAYVHALACRAAHERLARLF